MKEVKPRGKHIIQREWTCAYCNLKNSCENYFRLDKELVQMFPHLKFLDHVNDGRICFSCRNKLKTVVSLLTNKGCACCSSPLNGHQYKYKNQMYNAIFKELYPNSPLVNSDKVCQTCYARARSLLKQRTVISKQNKENEAPFSDNKITNKWIVGANGLQRMDNWICKRCNQTVAVQTEQKNTSSFDLKEQICPNCTRLKAPTSISIDSVLNRL